MGTFSTIDADANAGGAGFGLPGSNSGSGTTGQGPLYTLKIYKYRVDFWGAFGLTGAILLSPALAWVTNAGNPQDFIECDMAVLNVVTAGSVFYEASFEHDYGDEGLTVSRPQGTPTIDATNYYLGLVNRGGPQPNAADVSWSIDYGIDIDYRKITGPVLATP